jgi:hypothetical protein
MRILKHLAKGKVVLAHTMKAIRTAQVWFHSFLTSTLEGDEW